MWTKLNYTRSASGRPCSKYIGNVYRVSLRGRERKDRRSDTLSFSFGMETISLLGWKVGDLVYFVTDERGNVGLGKTHTGVSVRQRHERACLQIEIAVPLGMFDPLVSEQEPELFVSNPTVIDGVLLLLRVSDPEPKKVLDRIGVGTAARAARKPSKRAR